MHNQCPQNKEWSGLLIAKIIRGGIDDLENLEISCEHAFPMDFGDASFTSFEGSADYLTMFEKFPQVDPLTREADSPWFIGKIHSHHNMTSFHSGTDTTDLYETAPKLPFFLSLVVNYSCIPFAEIGIAAEHSETVVTRTKWKLATWPITGHDFKPSKKTEEACLVIPCNVTYQNDTWFVQQVRTVKEKNATKSLASTQTTTTRSYPSYTPGRTWTPPAKEDAASSVKANASEAKYTPRVYATVLSSLGDLFSLGCSKMTAAHAAATEVNGELTFKLRDIYMKALKQYFIDNWYEETFMYVEATPTEALEAILHYAGFYPGQWFYVMIQEVCNDLKREVKLLRTVQGPGVV